GAARPGRAAAVGPDAAAPAAGTVVAYGVESVRIPVRAAIPAVIDLHQLVFIAESGGPAVHVIHQLPGIVPLDAAVRVSNLPGRGRIHRGQLALDRDVVVRIVAAAVARADADGRVGDPDLVRGADEVGAGVHARDGPRAAAAVGVRPARPTVRILGTERRAAACGAAGHGVEGAAARRDPDVPPMARVRGHAAAERPVRMGP